MQVRSAVFRLLAGISVMVSSVAFAAADFSGEFECKGSYEKGCILFEAEQTRREMWIFFDGTVQENGGNGHGAVCSIRTAKLQQELGAAAIAAGAKPTDMVISEIRYSRLGARGNDKEYRCSYVVQSLRKDLRFTSHRHNRRFHTGLEEQQGVCMDDVREAKAIPNSIGASKFITAALAQGRMCETHYSLLGLDRVETDSTGKTVLLKFGSPKPYQQPTRSLYEN